MSNKVIQGDKHLCEPERKCQSSVNNNSNIRRLFEVSPPKNLKSRDRIQEALVKTLDTPVAYTAVYGYSIDWDGCTWTICNYAIACIPTLAMFIVTPIDLQGIETPARLYSKKNIESIKRDGNSSWTVYLRDEDVPITLVIPSYVPDIAECHGQYPIDQVEEAEIFSQLMECFPQKEL